MSSSSIRIPTCFAPFVKDPIFLVDTDILSDIAKGGRSKLTEENLLRKKTMLLYSITSIMELGFGPTISIPLEELEFYRSLYMPRSKIQKSEFLLTDFVIKRKLGELEMLRGHWVSICPDASNWFAAKNSLITFMNLTGCKPKKAKDLQIDMILNCLAWNAHAFIWTNNIKDHLLANYCTNYNLNRNLKNKSKLERKTILARNITPVFNTELIDRMLAGDEYNIYSELKKWTRNKEILDLLEIAECMVK